MTSRVIALFEEGLALEFTGAFDAAFACFERVVRIDPGHGHAWRQLGNLLRRVGRLGDASQCFEQAIAAGDDRQLNEFFLSAIGIGAVVPSAPPGFVVALFDQYAHRFDDHLRTALHYRAPERLASLVSTDRTVPFRSALDLGCGTGLAGRAFQALAESITGVDLSPRMLAQAALTGAYRRLVAGELLHFLRSSEERFDLVVACDVFIYLGDLTAVFVAVSRVLQPQGDFLFTIESCNAAGGFDHLPTLRYAHSEDYLRRLAAGNGFQIRAVSTEVLREEDGEPVAGLLVHLRLR